MPNIRNFVVLFILILSLGVSKPAVAQTLTPTPDPCSPDAPLSVPCPVARDSTNVTIPLQQTWLSNLLNSIWSSSLQPANGYRTGSEKLKTLNNQIQNASDVELNPAALQAIEKHDEQPKNQTMTSVECIVDADGQMRQYRSTERIVMTEDTTDLGKGIEGARRIGSFVTGYTQISQDYGLKNVVVDLNKVSCEPPSTGKKQTLLTTQTSGQNSFLSSIFSLLTGIVGSLFSSSQNSGIVQGKAVTPWIHTSLCLLGGCTESDIANVSYDSNKENVVKSGGAIAAMYKPAAINDTYNSERDAADPTQQWNVSVNGVNTLGETVNADAVNFAQARITAAGDYMNCTLNQADYQSTAVPDGSCKQNWTNASSSCNSTAKLPDTPSSACGLCNKDKIKDMADDKTNTVPEGIPPTMEAILTRAGEAYHVPPSSILAVMYHEGAFSGGRFTGENAWTEANVRAWSTCGKMPNCDQNASSAQAPYGFFPVYFTEFQDAVLVDDPDRKGNISLCNFMDVTYAAAKALNKLASTSVRARRNITEPLCFNSPMTIVKTPSSCTDWNDALVLKTHIFYGSYCPETRIITIRKSKGPLSQNEVPQDRFAGWVRDWYTTFRCN